MATIVLADDAVFIRQAFAALITAHGHCVIGEASTAPELISTVSALVNSDRRPDIVVTDVRMPPGNTNDGLRAAIEIRKTYPDLPIMILSAYVSGAYVKELLDSADGGIGYLLKERVGRAEEFLASLTTVLEGGVVLDPEVVAFLLSNAAKQLSKLTPREREVLDLMAQGLSNTDIATKLHFSMGAIGKHVANIFAKLGLDVGEENRRVKAVLMWLNAQGRT